MDSRPKAVDPVLPLRSEASGRRPQAYAVAMPMTSVRPGAEPEPQNSASP